MYVCIMPMRALEALRFLQLLPQFLVHHPSSFLSIHFIMYKLHTLLYPWLFCFFFLVLSSPIYTIAMTACVSIIVCALSKRARQIDSEILVTMLGERLFFCRKMLLQQPTKNFKQTESNIFLYLLGLICLKRQLKLRILRKEINFLNN